jgi:ribA/ribD-fused uncharacterized protein
MDDTQFLKDLQAQQASGAALKYIFFWGHQVGKSITASCFSQWYPIGFELDGVRYASSEHFMMAEKARLFGDVSVRERVLKTTDPAVAKKLGREIKAFDEAIWRQHRFAIVQNACHAKFSQNPELKRYLFQTGDRVLVEASPVDPIWGIGMAKDDPKAQDPSAWKGLNLLGFALMQARAQIFPNRQG